MSMLIKIMSEEDRADSCVGKGYTGIVLGPGDTFTFYRDEADNPHVRIDKLDGSMTIARLTGNAYVVSETGKTIATFAYANVRSR